MWRPIWDAHIMTLGQRLRTARIDAGRVLREIGEACGVSAQAVAQWESDTTKPSAAALGKVATFTGVSLKWLLYGVDDPKDDNPNSDVGTMGSVVPSVEWEDLKRFQAGDAGAVTGRVRSHFQCGGDAFRTFIRDRSNEPELPVGLSIIVDPDVMPAPGDFCLALVDGEYMVRRLFVRADHIDLVPANPAWKTTRAASQEEVIIGTITESSRRMT